MMETLFLLHILNRKKVKNISTMVSILCCIILTKNVRLILFYFNASKTCVLAFKKQFYDKVFFILH